MRDKLWTVDEYVPLAAMVLFLKGESYQETVLIGNERVQSSSFVDWTLAVTEMRRRNT